jgi:hypothetical protein
MYALDQLSPASSFGEHLRLHDLDSRFTKKKSYMTFVVLGVPHGFVSH